jgi:DNA polymerase-3 subunit delta'
MIKPSETERLYGHQDIEDYCFRQWQAHRLPQTLLLTGLEGVGKAAFAYRLTRFLLSGGGGGMFGPQDLFIEESDPVFQQVVQGSHGDLLVIEPELSGQNKTPVIKIDAVRKVSHFLAHTAATTAHRIIIVDGMDALNPQAANALLKAIEEPPAQALFLLIATAPSMVLPTIRSRAQLLRFQPLNEEDFRKAVSSVSDIPEEDIGFYFGLSGGSPGKALYYQEQNVLAGYGGLLEEMRGLDGGFVQWLGKRDTDVQIPLLRRLLNFMINRHARFTASALNAPFYAGENESFAAMLQQAAATGWLDRLNEAMRILSAAQGLHLERKQTIQQVMQTMSHG